MGSLIIGQFTGTAVTAASRPRLTMPLSAARVLGDGSRQQYLSLSDHRVQSAHQANGCGKPFADDRTRADVQVRGGAAFDQRSTDIRTDNTTRLGFRPLSPPV